MITLAKSNVTFLQDEHKYFLGDKELKGITSTLIRKAFPETYKDIPEYILNRAAERGSIVHEQLEMFNTVFNSDPSLWQGEWTNELSNFSHIMLEHSLKHIASEYLVTDEEHFASAIDAVFTDGEDGIVLADYKTTSQLHYDNVSLQLSIYANFFEAMNPDLKVSHIVCIWLHGAECKYVDLPRVSNEKIEALTKAYLENNESYVYKLDTPQSFTDLEKRYIELALEKDRISAELDTIKEQMLSLMKADKAKSYKTEYGSYAYIPSGKTQRFDATTFKKENEELYNKYMKDSKTKEQIRITLKKQ